MAGFSLIELTIVLGVITILLSFGVPAYKSFVSTQRLRGSTENLAAMIRLARERAMTQGQDQPLHFWEDAYDCDFHVHIGTVVSHQWSFPPGVHYAAETTHTILMKKDGTADPSGVVILKNDRGRRDTLSVLSSGIVLLR